MSIYRRLFLYSNRYLHLYNPQQLDSPNIPEAGNYTSGQPLFTAWPTFMTSPFSFGFDPLPMASPTEAR